MNTNNCESCRQALGLSCSVLGPCTFRDHLISVGDLGFSSFQDILWNNTASKHLTSLLCPERFDQTVGEVSQHPASFQTLVVCIWWCAGVFERNSASGIILALRRLWEIRCYIKSHGSLVIEGFVPRRSLIGKSGTSWDKRSC